MMEKSKFLRKFSYEDFMNGSYRRVTTWNGKEVNVVNVMNGYRILAIVRDEDGYEIPHTYNYQGECLDDTINRASEDPDMNQIYLDSSVVTWVNVSISDIGKFDLSKGFRSKDEALNNREENEFDTVMIRMPG